MRSAKKGLTKKILQNLLVAEKLDYQFYFHNKTVSPTIGLHDSCSQIIKINNQNSLILTRILNTAKVTLMLFLCSLLCSVVTTVP